LTGKKWDQREHLTHSGYPGGQKVLSPRSIYDKNPAKLVEMAVKRMLPKGKLGSEIFRNLHVYSGTEHPHAAQEPKAYTIKL